MKPKYIRQFKTLEMTATDLMILCSCHESGELLITHALALAKCRSWMCQLVYCDGDGKNPCPSCDSSHPFTEELFLPISADERSWLQIYYEGEDKSFIGYCHPRDFDRSEWEEESRRHHERRNPKETP